MTTACYRQTSCCLPIPCWCSVRNPDNSKAISRLPRCTIALAVPFPGFPNSKAIFLYGQTGSCWIASFLMPPGIIPFFPIPAVWRWKKSIPADPVMQHATGSPVLRSGTMPRPDLRLPFTPHPTPQRRPTTPISFASVRMGTGWTTICTFRSTPNRTIPCSMPAFTAGTADLSASLPVRNPLLHPDSCAGMATTQAEQASHGDFTSSGSLTTIRTVGMSL